MKIVLIRPNMGQYKAKDAMQPLVIGVLAARAKMHEVLFYDDRIEEVPDTIQADLIAITVETFTARRAYQLADHFRAQGIAVVLGGYHPSFLPQEALKHADAIMVGDAEGIWEELLSDFEQHKLQAVYQNEHTDSLDDFQLDRQVFSKKRYLPVQLVQFSRGCRFVCDFCSIHAFYQNGVRTRSVASLKTELCHFDSKRFMIFVDDNLFSNRTTLQELLTMLAPLKRRWGCQISIDVARDVTLLDQLAQAGCRYVLIGFESLNTANLKQMGKPWNHVAGDYAQVIHQLHKRGISIYGTFVFGYDQDTLESLQQTVAFAIEHHLEIANFNLLTPTPGSVLYQRLEQEDRLLFPAWWIDEHYRYGDPIFIPKNMAPMALAQACFQARKQFYSFGAILKRLLNFKYPITFKDRFITLLANIVSYYEIRTKQGRYLGQ